MRPNLVLYFEETNDDGAVDAQVFVAFDRNIFRVYATRDQGKSSKPVPMTRLAFNGTHGVLRFLKTLMGWRIPGYRVAAELHVTDKYDVSSDFNDLWNVTGKDTELAAWDNDKFCNVRRYLDLLEHADAEAMSFYSKRGNSPHAK